ncbi:MAG TPA: hypothetical protein VKY31_10305 [Terriglobia bacterium]|jgi:hypothetical protein|nr:hypothetical protein [Terriglobia bacterium]
MPTSPDNKGASWRVFRDKVQKVRRGVEDLAGQLENLTAKPPEEAWSGVSFIQRELEVWTRLGDDLPRRLRAALDAVRKQKDDELASFELRLARELKARGHSVFGQTATFIADGIVHVDTSELSEGRISVNETAVEPPTVQAVVGKVGEEVTRLKKAITPPSQLLEAIWTAYQLELRQTGKALGAQVETTAIMLRLAMQRQTSAFRSNPQARNFREYSKQSFRADLYTLLSSGELVIKGHRFRCAAGADTRGAIFMFVPALQRPTHVGRLWFEATETTS